jgi:Flp pilus assembly protein TadD
MKTMSPEYYAKRGRAQLRRGDFTSAATSFRTATELDAQRNRRQPEMRHLSYYGLSLARAGLSFNIALQACRTAVSRQQRDPVLFLNLARIYKLGGKRVAAIKALEDGLRIEPGHRYLRKELSLIDRRSAPVIGFLSRDNSLNRKLGRMRAGRGKSRPLTVSARP